MAFQPLGDPALDAILQQQQQGDQLAAQASAYHPSQNWAGALAQAVQGGLAALNRSRAQDAMQQYQQGQDANAQKLLAAYTAATAPQGAPTQATNLDANGMPTSQSQPEQAARPDPQAAQQVLAQALMSNDPRMQKWAAITMSQTPQNRQLTDSQIASNFAPNDYTPESWKAFMQSRNMGDLVPAKDDSDSGHWGKSPDGRTVWYAKGGSVQFAPKGAAGAGGDIDESNGLNTHVDPTSGMMYYRDNKGQPHVIPGQINDQNRADEANTMLGTINNTGNLVASLPVPSGLVGRVATGMEKLGDVLGGDDTSRQALENNIYMLRQGMVNQLTGSRRQPTKEEQAQVEQILPLYNPMTTRAAMVEHLQGAENWIKSRNSGALWRSQGRPGSQQPQPPAEGTPAPAQTPAAAPAAPMSAEEWLGRD